MSQSTWGRLFKGVLCWLAMGAAADAQAASTCKSVSFIVDVSSRAAFQTAIGGDLIFRFDPARLGPKGELDGWEMYLATADAPQDDYIYPVNPPLRFNGAQIFGASYGDAARGSLSRPREVWFLLSRADYDRLWPFVTNALWPYHAPQPDQAGDEYVHEAKALSLGVLKVEVLAFQMNQSGDSLTHMKVQATFIAPQNFQFQAGLKASSRACPGKWNF